MTRLVLRPHSFFRGKRILQLLCKESIGWDDAIPDDLQMQWEKWRCELPLLEMLEMFQVKGNGKLEESRATSLLGC